MSYNLDERNARLRNSSWPQAGEATLWAASERSQYRLKRIGQVFSILDPGTQHFIIPISSHNGSNVAVVPVTTPLTSTIIPGICLLQDLGIRVLRR